MPRLRCASIDCKHNHDCHCTLRDVMLMSRFVHTAHNGFCHFLECGDYAMSEDYLELLTALGKNPQLSADKEEV